MSYAYARDLSAPDSDMENKTIVEPVTQIVSPSTVDLGTTELLPQLGPRSHPDDLGTFGGYRIVRMLGYGAMGVVYQAIDPVLGRMIALKVMLPRLASSLTARKRFLREARSAAAVKHDHIVTIFQIGEHANCPFLTMEYLSGSTLAARFQQGPILLGEAIRIGRDIAVGLAAAHSAGVIHRDIKLENIWLEAPTNRVKILDFGLARMADDDRPLTSKGALLGTVGFMAPEQARGQPADKRSDLFGLGVVLYCLTTGRFPFSGSTVMEVLTSLAVQEPVWVESLNPTISPELAMLIHRLLAKDPAARPADAAGVARALAEIETQLLMGTIHALRTGPTALWEALDEAASSGLGKSSDGPLMKTRRSGTRWTFVGVIGAAVLVVAGTLLSVALLRPDPQVQAEVTPATKPTPIVAKPASPKATAFPSGFVSLFNGKNLSGWVPPNGGRSDAWGVVNGVLTATPQQGGDQWLLSDREYEDFDFRLEYRWPEKGGHTVIMLRGKPTAENAVDGLMVNIGDDDHFPEIHGREIGTRYQTGGIQAIQVSPSPLNRPIGEWNSLRIISQRQRIRVVHNDRETVNVDLDEHANRAGKMPAIARSRGAIVLTAHWGRVEFRNLFLGPANP